MALLLLGPWKRWHRKAPACVPHIINFDENPTFFVNLTEFFLSNAVFFMRSGGVRRRRAADHRKSIQIGIQEAVHKDKGVAEAPQCRRCLGQLSPFAVGLKDRAAPDWSSDGI
jgi:hypothetical protein